MPELMRGPNARRTDPATSHLAAADATPNAATHRARAYAALHAELPGGLTDFELAARLGVQQTSIGKRRGELRDTGWVEDSGERRAAPSGSKAIVWRALRTPRAPEPEPGEQGALFDA